MDGAQCVRRDYRTSMVRGTVRGGRGARCRLEPSKFAFLLDSRLGGACAPVKFFLSNGHVHDLYPLPPLAPRNPGGQFHLWVPRGLVLRRHSRRSYLGDNVRRRRRGQDCPR